MLIYTNVLGQNLVPNGSFEIAYPNCLQDVGATDIRVAPPWWNVCSSPDRYSSDTCYMPSPYYFDGFYSDIYQTPRTGDAFAGYGITNTTAPILNQEFLQVGLISPLISGRKYCLEFYVSLSTYDNINNITGIDCIQAAFSTDTVGCELVYDNSLLDPVITNPLGTIINDTLGWTKVSGEFIAVGNEKMLVIGCFEDLNTITVNGQIWTDYYFLDDVSLTMCDNDTIPEPSETTIEIYNQNNEGQILFAFNNSLNEILTANIYDYRGRLIHSKLTENHFLQFGTTGLSNGIYFIVIESTQGIRGSRKFTIIN